MPKRRLPQWMQLVHPGSYDPIGDALGSAVRAAADHTEDQPLTPEQFWVRLSTEGFAFPGNPPGSEEHGRFFAHLVLDHAVAKGLMSGNTARHQYWFPPTGERSASPV